VSAPAPWPPPLPAALATVLTTGSAACPLSRIPFVRSSARKP
jgi:hypothetical protein